MHYNLRLSFAILFLNSFCLNAQNERPFELKGQIGSDISATVFLHYFDLGHKFIDSVKLDNGSFKIDGYISEPINAALYLKKQNSSIKEKILEDFYLDTARMQVSFSDEDLSSGTLTGSPTQDEWMRIKNKLYPPLDSINNVQDDSLSRALSEDAKQVILSFVNEFPKSTVVLKVLPWLSKYGVSYDSLGKLWTSIDTSFYKSYGYKFRSEFISKSIQSQIGRMAEDFSRVDLHKKAIRLSDFKGKYVLLDFWASWCFPCRKFSPRLKEFYKNYHGAGLEVIAISCDLNRDDWLSAVKEDSMELFHNILSFNDKDMNLDIGTASFDGELRKQFNFMPIPAQILIDRDGVIIGRFIADEILLENKLKEVFSR